MATSRKTGLGKGLNALFSTGIEEEQKVETKEEEKEKNKAEDNSEQEVKGKVLNLKINEVEPNRNQQRKSFNEETLEELAE